MKGTGEGVNHIRIFSLGMGSVQLLLELIAGFRDLLFFFSQNKKHRLNQNVHFNTFVIFRISLNSHIMQAFARIRVLLFIHIIKSVCNVYPDSSLHKIAFDTFALSVCENVLLVHTLRLIKSVTVTIIKTEI